jgi:hypothetical protein
MNIGSRAGLRARQNLEPGTPEPLNHFQLYKLAENDRVSLKFQENNHNPLF